MIYTLINFFFPSQSQSQVVVFFHGKREVRGFSLKRIRCSQSSVDEQWWRGSVRGGLKSPH